jgi:hypothetical protein
MRVRARALMIAVLLAVLLLPATPAAGGEQRPLTVKDFTPFVAGPSVPGDPFTQGFGDRNNSWAWSMVWWRGKLYVGTSRAYRCFSRASLARVAGFLFPYPPPDPDSDCPTDTADLPLRAEIWSWTPETNTWERLFQSPQDIPVPGRSDKWVARDIGFRGMVVHTDRHGVEALYAVGLNSAALWEGEKVVPPPRILYTTTGEKDSFQPIPQAKGTFMGELSKGSFRSPTSYDGRLFVLHGTIQGNGVLLASDDPMQGNDAWEEVGPPGTVFFEIEPFNGWLYLGSLDMQRGYTVLKTKAEGDPYQFTTVVPAGGLLQRVPGQKPSGAVVSMHQFNGRLYVGTDNPAELVRINPNDTWELIAGTARVASDGSWIFPLSGLEDGFAHQLNDHIWRQGSQDGYLYIGTYDATVNWKEDATHGPRFAHLQGTDVYRTSDGWYFTPVTMNGFGDRFNFGTRSFASTPFGLFLGTANDFYGLNIFKASPPQSSPLPAPGRLEVEVAQQRPVLSWNPVPAATRYRVHRANMYTVLLSSNPEIDSTESQRQESWMHEPFEEIAVTRDTIFVDTPAASGARRLYLIVAEDEQGRLSEFSNLVVAPSLTPQLTFSRLLRSIDRFQQSGRFTSPEAAKDTLLAIQQASGLAVANRMAAASDVLETLRQQVLYGAIVFDPDAQDLEILLGKLIRRMKLVRHGYLQQPLLF